MRSQLRNTIGMGALVLGCLLLRLPPRSRPWHVSAAPKTPDPVEVFRDLDGTWEGTFVGYRDSGEELYRIRVSQTYRTVGKTRQEVTIRDTLPNGTVITGTGANTATRGDDGSLGLQCVVEKSNGERVTHSGRTVRGPDGDVQIIWYSRQPDRVETFRETVRKEGEQTIYSIDGMGRYGTTWILMHGRYRKRA